MSEANKRAIELFINTFVKDPTKRAKSEGACSYYDKDTGNKCIVGHMLYHPEDVKLQGAGVRQLTTNNNDPDPELFKPEFVDVDINLLEDLQELHDDNFRNYFRDNEFTLTGRNKLARLIEIHV